MLCTTYFEGKKSGLNNQNYNSDGIKRIFSTYNQFLCIETRHIN